MKAQAALVRLGGVARTGDLLTLTTRRRLRTAVEEGRIIRLHRGRFALPSAATAAKDAAAVSGVVSHLSAALHWGWAVKWAPEMVWVTVPRKRHSRRFRDGRVRLVLSDLSPGEVVDGVTSPVRTVLDCARALPFDQALTVADAALRSRLVDPDELRAAARQARGPGSAQCRRVSRQATPRAANPFESVLRAIVMEFPDLLVEPQGSLTTRHRTYHPDLLERRLLLAIEADSWEFHTGKGAHARDCVRYTEMTLCGWRVLRFTWDQVMHHPDYVRGVLELAAKMPPAR